MVAVMALLRWKVDLRDVNTRWFKKHLSLTRMTDGVLCNSCIDRCEVEDGTMAMHTNHVTQITRL